MTTFAVAVCYTPTTQGTKVLINDFKIAKGVRYFGKCLMPFFYLMVYYFNIL